MKIVVRHWVEDNAARLYEIYRSNPDMVRQMSALTGLVDARDLVGEGVYS